MDKLKASRSTAGKALDTLDEILQVKQTVFNRDASIHRFEYTTEAFWKWLKRHLLVHEGISEASPKQVIRAALKAGIIDKDKTMCLLEMIDDRNLASHTYIEKVAIVISQKIPGYAKVMREVLNITDL